MFEVQPVFVSSCTHRNLSVCVFDISSTAINKTCVIVWLIFSGMFWDSTYQTQFSGCPVYSIGTTYVTDQSIKIIQKLLVVYSFFYDDFLMRETSDFDSVVIQISQV